MNNSDSWKVYFSEGIDYMRTAENAAVKRGIYTPVIIYNIAAMSMEKLIMSMLMRNGLMPEGHTFHDMIKSLKNITELDPGIESGLINIDAMQPICSFSDVPAINISDGDVDYCLDVLHMINKLVLSHIEDERELEQ